MVCLDTNCIIAYLAGDSGAGVEFLRKLLARRADTLIAQSCLDHKTPLLTRDKGFLRFGRLL